MPDAIDVFGFAGGMTLGVVQSGWSLIGKRETSDFGVPNMLANRHLLGYGWDVQTDVTEWEPLQADMVFGNPPCSGFSLMSSKSTRGIDAKVNACMWQLTDFASRCDPTMVIFESVQGAFTSGLELMRALRENLERRSGDQYGLWHVKHDAYALGGCAIRRRYFFVASRVPFGVEPMRFDRYPTWWDAISDLSDLEESWEDQPIHYGPSWWLERDHVRRADGLVDGHIVREPDMGQRRLRHLLDLWGDQWAWDENEHDILKKHYDTHGEVPEPYQRWQEQYIKRNWEANFYPPTRPRADGPARVMTGAAMSHLVHPTQPRTLTHREVARVMGFPDEWRIAPLRDVKGLEATWGKGVTVHCGRWIGTWARRALEGDPGSLTGEELGDREWLIEVKRPSKAELDLLAAV